jgi:uncharacterized protein
MKKLTMLLLLVPMLIKAQDITGQWNGILKVQGMELRLVFHISEKDSIYSVIMDSPDQNAFGIPTGTTSFENSTLKIELAQLGARYEGQFGINVINGTFFQAGQAFPFNLTKHSIEKKQISRPQEPRKPYPYNSEEVKFPSDDGKISLAGTLTLPMGKKNFPTAILISGSGPQNRDEEFMTHRPFLVLADYLTRNGIAVLRYDDRGFAESTGDHKSATTYDFSNDVRSAIRYLKNRGDIDPKQIGLIGHSEGGLITPIVASDTKVAFVVLLAGPGVSGDQILLKQTELMGEASGKDEKSIQQELALQKVFLRRSGNIMKVIFWK